MLKLLCGYVASGNFKLNVEDWRQWTPPIEWLKILFGDEEFQPSAGLYGDRIGPDPGHGAYSLKPYFDQSLSEPMGLSFVVGQLRLILATENVWEGWSPVVFSSPENRVYRPNFVKGNINEDLERTIYFYY